MFYLQPSEIEGVEHPAAVANGDGKEEGEETEERPIKKVVEFKVACYSLFWNGREGWGAGAEREREREKESRERK